MAVKDLIAIIDNYENLSETHKIYVDNYFEKMLLLF